MYPQITIFIGGTNHSQSWVVYGIVLPTLLGICPQLLGISGGQEFCFTRRKNGQLQQLAEANHQNYIEIKITQWKDIQKSKSVYIYNWCSHPFFYTISFDPSLISICGPSTPWSHLSAPSGVELGPVRCSATARVATSEFFFGGSLFGGFGCRMNPAVTTQESYKNQNNQSIEHDRL